MLTDKDRPEAICCSDSFSAHHVRMVAAKLGLRVPEDLALVSCDTETEDPTWLCQPTGLTNVSWSQEEVWKKALDLLEEMASQPKAARIGRLWDPVMMPLHLTVKDSCGAKLRGAAT